MIMFWRLDRADGTEIIVNPLAISAVDPCSATVRLITGELIYLEHNFFSRFARSLDGGYILPITVFGEKDNA